MSNHSNFHFPVYFGMFAMKFVRTSGLMVSRPVNAFNGTQSVPHTNSLLAIEKLKLCLITPQHEIIVTCGVISSILIRIKVTIVVYPAAGTTFNALFKTYPDSITSKSWLNPILIHKPSKLSKSVKIKSHLNHRVNIDTVLSYCVLSSSVSVLSQRCKCAVIKILIEVRFRLFT